MRARQCGARLAEFAVEKSPVQVSKRAAGHATGGAGMRSLPHLEPAGSVANRRLSPTLLPKLGLDDLGERVAGPVETRLHRAKIAMRDLGDLLV